MALPLPSTLALALLFNSTLRETHPRQPQSLLLVRPAPGDNRASRDAQLPTIPSLADQELVHTDGVREGKDPNPLFDTSFYLLQYPDVAASGINPLAHYATFGAVQRRLPNRWFGERRHLRNALTRLETAAASHVDANEFDAALQLIQLRVAEVCTCTGRRGWISGHDRLDGLCLLIGREIRGVADRRRPVSQAGRRRCVYVVSELYRDGGHTRLLEDLIAAQPQADHRLIWTWGESADAIAHIAEILRVREAVPLKVLRGKPVERLREAFAFLTEVCPDVLVHLGHPNDPLAIALMQPGIARRQLIIHHSDWSFALGRSLGETVHVALGPHFQDFARREWALETVLLPLTCGEPVVAKAVNWETHRPFLTVTSGASGKFDLSGASSYLDILRERFAAREGAHVMWCLHKTGQAIGACLATGYASSTASRQYIRLRK